MASRIRADVSPFTSRRYALYFIEFSGYLLMALPVGAVAGGDYGFGVFLACLFGKVWGALWSKMA